MVNQLPASIIKTFKGTRTDCSKNRLLFYIITAIHGLLSVFLSFHHFSSLLILHLNYIWRQMLLWLSGSNAGIGWGKCFFFQVFVTHNKGLNSTVHLSSYMSIVGWYNTALSSNTSRMLQFSRWYINMFFSQVKINSTAYTRLWKT